MNEKNRMKKMNEMIKQHQSLLKKHDKHNSSTNKKMDLLLVLARENKKLLKRILLRGGDDINSIDDMLQNLESQANDIQTGTQSS